MQQAIRFEDHKGLIHFQAKRGLKWAAGAGVALDYDDMFQEASVAFLQAAEGYREDSGFKFSAYYTMAAFSQFRKTIGVQSGVKNLNATQRAEIAERKAHNALMREKGVEELPEMNYGLRPAYFSDMESTTDDGMSSSFEATLASNSPNPEEQYAFKQAFEQATAGLSPLAQLTMAWLREPPPQLLEELEFKKRYTDLCKANGVSVKRFDEGISIRNVTNFIALVGSVSAGDIKLVEAELDAVGKRLEEALENE